MTKRLIGVTGCVLSFGRGPLLQDRQPFFAGRMGGGFNGEDLICHLRGVCHFGGASLQRDLLFGVKTSHRAWIYNKDNGHERSLCYPHRSIFCDAVLKATRKLRTLLLVPSKGRKETWTAYALPITAVSK